MLFRAFNLSLPVQLLTTVRGGINDCTRRVAESYQINISHCLFKQLSPESFKTVRCYIWRDFCRQNSELSLSFDSILPATNSFWPGEAHQVPDFADVCNISYYPPKRYHLSIHTPVKRSRKHIWLIGQNAQSTAAHFHIIVIETEYNLRSHLRRHFKRV